MLIRFRSEVGPAKQEAILSAVSSRVKYFRRPAQNNLRPQIQTGGQGNLAVSVFDRLALVKLDERANLETAMEQFQRNPAVSYVEPNYRFHISHQSAAQIIPDDFEFPKMWGLNNTGQTNGKENADIDAPEAWALTTGDKRVKVAVIDTGVDYYHPDLAENIWLNQGEIPGNGIDDDGNGYIDDVHGYDFVSDDSDPMDDNNHGTHVAGIIGAVGNNKIGVAGVCWHVNLMAVKAFDENGVGDTDQIIEAIRYSVANGANIINASWGGNAKSRVLEEAVQEAHNAGVVFVAAAGNDSTETLSYPAAYDGVIAVAAIDQDDERATFSNYGSYVAVAAPGENIYSTLPDNSYGGLSGTSMAAPHVSGLAALILARHPEFTNQDIESIIRNTATPIVTDQYVGAGRINAYQALLVDAPLPVVKLNLPETLYGNVNFQGTAKGNDFVSYALEYGKGSNPTNWTKFHTSTVSVEQGELFANFYTPGLDEGIYTFKLTATNSKGQAAVDRVTDKVQNVHIVAPMNNDVLRAGETITISGTVLGQNRTFTIEYGRGWQPTAWFSDGITLVNGGVGEVLDAPLATWDTHFVGTNEFYTLKLTARDQDKVVGESVVHMVYLDGQLRPGWPQYLPVVGDYPIEDWRDIKVADLDHDGYEEIILVDHGNSDGKPARLLVYKYDGSLLWSRELASGAPYSDIPVVGDVDNDGFLEIFVDTGNTLFAFKHDGTPLPGKWPVRLEATGLGKVLADLDGDGFPELIAYSQNPVNKAGTDFRQLTVFDRQGNRVRTWDIPFCSTSIDAEKIFPAVGNLDSDPDLEIVAVSGCSAIAAYKLNQPVDPIWTSSVDGVLLASPVIGDLNHDGTNEVIIGASKEYGGYQGGLYALNNQGKRLAGWPVLVDESFTAAPALADFEGDGFLEICIPSWSSQKLHLIHHYGFEADGWPVAFNRSSIKTSPVIGDIDGDGRLDVVLASPGNLRQAVSLGDLTSVGGVKAWSFNGEPIDLNPKDGLACVVMESSGGSSLLKAAPIILTDIDHNGALDIVAVTVQDTAYSPDAPQAVRKNRSSIYVWQLDVPYIAEKMPWPTFQGNPQNTGRYDKPKHINQAPVVTDIPDQTVRVGKSFFPVELDGYVEDPDNKVEEISWRAVGNSQLKVSIDTNRIATITPPDSNWTGEETIRFIARDPGGLESSDTAVFSVKTDYDPPIASEDRVSTPEDIPIEIDVLANDTDPQGNPLRVSNFSRPRFGTLKAAPSGTLIYTPSLNYNGTDTFSYTVSDGKGGMSIGSVSVEVLPVNDPPVAAMDRVITDEDTPLTIDVLANDSEVDGDPLTLLEYTQPANGSVVRSGDGTFVYTPNRDYNGLDGFTYIISDGHGLESTGTVSVLVKPIEDPPIAKDQEFSLNRNLSQDVTFQADDADGDPLTFSVIKGPEHGALFAYPAVANYYPNKNFAGTDSFTYVAYDGQVTSQVATVIFKVLDVNNPPVAESQAVVTKVEQPLTITLHATDPDEDPLTYQIREQPTNGTLNGNDFTFTYQPKANFIGTDRFTFQAFDGRTNSVEATVSIKITDLNTAPIARDFEVATKMNVPTNITLQASDGEGNPLTYQILSQPGNGKLSGTGAVVTYTPAQNYIGSDRFSFKVNDGELDSDLATVSIFVLTPNQAPVAKDQSITVPRNQSTTISLSVSDAENDPLNSPILKGPQHGRLTGTGTTFKYTPKQDFVGIDSFTYKTWDGFGYSNKGRVSIIVTPFREEYSPQFESIERLPDGGWRILLKTQAGKRFHIEASTNLIDWFPLESITADSATVSVVDTNTAGFKQRFYRAAQF